MITGAASGIGRAAAVRVASEGGNLALLDIDSVALKNLVKELKHNSNKVVYAQCDVTNFQETRKVIDDLCEQMGSIQALSHNAGILRCYNTHEMTFDQWNEIISVNLTGTFNVNRHAIPHLIKNPTSYLVNTSSLAAECPHPWLTAYAASKGGIKSFTRSLFIEYALQGLRANCILPGGFKTKLAGQFSIPPGANPDLVKYLNPLGKDNEADTIHIAGVIALLLSDDAFHINGTEIAVDGGKIGGNAL